METQQGASGVVVIGQGFHRRVGHAGGTRADRRTIGHISQSGWQQITQHRIDEAATCVAGIVQSQLISDRAAGKHGGRAGHRLIQLWNGIGVSRLRRRLGHRQRSRTGAVARRAVIRIAVRACVGDGIAG